MKILLSTGSLYHLKDEETFSLASKFGFSGIELVLQTPKSSLALNIEEIKSLSRRYHLPVYSIHSPSFERFLKDFILSPRLTTLRALTSSLRIADELGAKVLVVHPLPALLLRTRVRRNMEVILSKLPPHSPDLKICLENMPAIGRKPLSIAPHSLRKPKEFRDFCLQNNCFMVLDVTHPRTTNFSSLDFFKLNKERIVDIHLSDFKDGRQHLPLGKGDTDFLTLFTAFKKANYDGFLTLELEPKRISSYKILGECKEFIEELWQKA